MVVLAHDFCACHWVWCLVFSVSPQMFLLMNLAFAVGQLGDGRPIYGIMLKCRKHIYMYIIVYIYIYIYLSIYVLCIHVIFLDGSTGPRVFLCWIHDLLALPGAKGPQKPSEAWQMRQVFNAISNFSTPFLCAYGKQWNIHQRCVEYIIFIEIYYDICI